MAERGAVEPYLVRALWRAGLKLVVGLGLIGALIGLRISAARPTGIEGDIAELDALAARLDAEKAAGAVTDGAPIQASPLGSESNPEGAAPGERAGVDPTDRDRLVRCRIDGALQYMRAADCEMRVGRLEELPPPPPEADPATSAEAQTTTSESHAQPPAAPAS